jgi:glycosyltransferase involved in cell wall biosynthesis
MHGLKWLEMIQDIRSWSKSPLAILERDPEVSIIMPNHNNERFLSAAIDSVMGQTFPDLELIIVDDSSTDGSAEIAKRYSRTQSRIRVIQLDHQGGSAVARNRGIEASRGSKICFVDSDDVYSPRKLEAQLEAFNHAKQTVVVYCDWWRIDETGNNLGPSRRAHPRKSGRIFSDAMAQTYGGIVMCMIPRICFDKVGLFDEALLWAEDLDLLLRLAGEFDFEYVDQALYGYRSHGTSKRMTAGRQERLVYEALVTERHFLNGKVHIDDGAREQVLSNLIRYYRLTNQKGKMLRYGLSSFFGFRKMLSLVVKERTIRG